MEYLSNHLILIPVIIVLGVVIYVLLYNLELKLFHPSEKLLIAKILDAYEDGGHFPFSVPRYYISLWCKRKKITLEVTSKMFKKVRKSNLVYDKVLHLVFIKKYLLDVRVHEINII